MPVTLFFPEVWIFLLSFSEPLKVPRRPATMEAVAAVASRGLTPERVSKGPLFASVIFFPESRQPRLGSLLLLWSCLFYLKPFLCFTVPDFCKHTLRITWTHVVKPFLHKAKTPHILDPAGADPPWSWSLSGHIITSEHLKLIQLKWILYFPN